MTRLPPIRSVGFATSILWYKPTEHPNSELKNPPRVFISCAWENKALVRRMEKELRAAGAEVWVDHGKIRGGDRISAHTSDALRKKLGTLIHS